MLIGVRRAEGQGQGGCLHHVQVSIFPAMPLHPVAAREWLSLKAGMDSWGGMRGLHFICGASLPLGTKEGLL